MAIEFLQELSSKTLWFVLLTTRTPEHVKDCERRVFVRSIRFHGKGELKVRGSWRRRGDQSLFCHQIPVYSRCARHAPFTDFHFIRSISPPDGPSVPFRLSTPQEVSLSSGIHFPRPPAHFLSRSASGALRSRTRWVSGGDNFTVLKKEIYFVLGSTTDSGFSRTQRFLSGCTLMRPGVRAVWATYFGRKLMYVLSPPS